MSASVRSYFIVMLFLLERGNIVILQIIETAFKAHYDRKRKIGFDKFVCACLTVYNTYVV